MPLTSRTWISAVPSSAESRDEHGRDAREGDGEQRSHGKWSYRDAS
ncbi:MAG TPA: hypothetical protein VMV16_05125 [Solirubrobacteraceae bacterium]|nr:hypothetical protein [Solirubrobacteraceae bacterium]